MTPSGTGQGGKAKPPAPPKYHGLKLMEQSDGNLLAVWPVLTYRFMFDDGSTIDVQASRDDSDLRGALVDWSGGHAIVGSADVTP